MLGMLKTADLGGHDDRIPGAKREQRSATDHARDAKRAFELRHWCSDSGRSPPATRSTRASRCGWATMRRRAGSDAIMESLQRVFTQLADEESLVQLVVDTARHALALG